MRPTRRLLVGHTPSNSPEPRLINIHQATFYKEHPSSTSSAAAASNPPIFPNLSFHIKPTQEVNVGKDKRIAGHWAAISPNPTTFLNVLQGGYICDPPGARTYPYLSSHHIPDQDAHLRVPSRAIRYVGFNAQSPINAPGGVRGAYLSARYESRREETDWSLQQYLRGQTELNPSTVSQTPPLDDQLFANVVRDLSLEPLLELPVSHLSNGQTRRSRIAKALLDRPKILLLDEPFMGLDPPTLTTLSPMLGTLSRRSSPLVVLGLRPQDPVPDWITNIVYTGERDNTMLIASKHQVFFSLYSWMRASQGGPETTTLEKEIATKLTSTYGPPPNALPLTLTPRGLFNSGDYERAWQLARASTSKDQNGLIDSSAIKKVKQAAHEARLAIPEKSRSASDWLMLTTILTRTDADFINTSSKKLTQTSDEAQTNADESQKRASAKSKQLQGRTEPLIELNSIVVKYGPKIVLGHGPPQPGFSEPGLNLTIWRGTRLLLLGPNGSGKTTLLSLLTSDHPQSYSLPIKFFGRTRLPAPGKPGLSLWEIQSRIGHSSPEVHAFFPKGMTVRQVLESAWAETFSSKPALTPERNDMVDHFLKIWKPELCFDAAVDPSDDSVAWASDKIRHPPFGGLPFGTQRLLLLLRAIIRQPDIIILDEPFSGLDAKTRVKAMNWLEHGTRSITGSEKHESRSFPGLTDQQALVVVSHVQEEVPDCIDQFVRLPSQEEAMRSGKQGRTVEIGSTQPGYMKSLEGWNQAWGLRQESSVQPKKQLTGKQQKQQTKRPLTFRKVLQGEPKAKGVRESVHKRGGEGIGKTAIRSSSRATGSHR